MFDLYKESDLSLVGILLTVELGGVDQVLKSSSGFLPLAGLQTTVRIDPELLRLEVP